MEVSTAESVTEPERLQAASAEQIMGTTAARSASVRYAHETAWTVASYWNHRPEVEAYPVDVFFLALKLINGLVNKMLST